MIEKIHDALRAEGLVPEKEDHPLAATSSDYYAKFQRAMADLDIEEIESLQVQYKELEIEAEAERSKATKLQSDLNDAREDFKASERQVAALTKELGVSRLALEIAEKRASA